MALSNEKKGWKGPLVDATEGMSAMAIGDALGYGSLVQLNNVMRAPARQVDLKASRYRGLYDRAPARNKALIEKFFLDDLLLA